jgi:hypothetical protein
MAWNCWVITNARLTAFNVRPNKSIFLHTSAQFYYVAARTEPAHSDGAHQSRDIVIDQTHLARRYRPQGLHVDLHRSLT